ncbi:MAG TPA: hypothetical protein VHN77_01870 [Phycisphaerales bacterium]|nr:hypothetical protein [Phycisphaerales bacterium]
MECVNHRNPRATPASPSRNTRLRRGVSAAALVLAAGWTNVTNSHAQALTTAFTYQGELQNGGTPVDGAHDLRFRLYDALASGTQLGTTLCVDNVQVVGGKFTVQLDFGSQFAGQQRFLDIQVRPDTGLDCSNATGYTLLTPRQSLTASPYASYAPSAGAAATATTATNATQLNGQSAGFYQNASNLTAGTIPDARMASNVVRTNFSNSFTGTNVFTGFTTFSGAVQSTNPASVYIGDGSGLNGLWKMGGNSATDPATHFIGTTDGQPFNVRVDNRRTVTISPAYGTYGPEPIFTAQANHGADTNFITPGLLGATICGGGLNTYNNATLGETVRNSVLSHLGTVVGGFGNKIGTFSNSGFVGAGEFNTVSGYAGVVGGGVQNTASGERSVVAGGWGNQATNIRATVGGGVNNTASGDHSTVAGGYNNTASGGSAFVPGGANCLAQGALSAAMGNLAKAYHDGSFVWGDSSNALLESTAPNQFLIRAGGGVGINTAAPNARLNVYGPANGGVNIFTGDLAPFGAAGIEANFSAAGIGSSAIIYAAVDGAERFSVHPNGDGFFSHDLQAGGIIAATGSIQSTTGNVLAGSNVVMDQSGAGTAWPELRLRGVFGDPLGLSVEVANSYSIVNLDNNFRMEGRTTGARGGMLRIDGRDYSFGLPLFQFWHKATTSATENQVAAIDHAGNMSIPGTFSAAAKFFHIDHPTDPANKTLRHACIESDEYKNIYDGVATTDGSGYATITLPSWMTDLNENFRYQLTVIDETDSGDPLMWARVVRKVDASNTFMVRTSSGCMEVSWQVTGTRKDAWAKANPFTPENDKTGTDKGKFLTPEAFGRPASDGLNTGAAFEARAAQHAVPARAVPTDPGTN